MTKRQPRPPSVPPAPPSDPPGRPGHPLRDLIAWVHQEPEKLLEVFPSLSLDDQTNLFLLASGDLRRELLAVAPRADQLVARLPVQEAYLSLKEIGYADALPLLARLTPEQIRYWIDLDTWRQEEFLPEAFLFCFQVMHACGQDRLARWLETVDPEPIVLSLVRYGFVSKLDIFKDAVEEESDLPPYVTFDGYYRYHCTDDAARPHLEAALRILFARDPNRYAMMLESAVQDVPSEVQEEALRFRNGRLADRGIPSFEEAMQIYLPLPDEAFHDLVRTVPPDRARQEPFGALYPVRWLSADSFLRAVLRTLAGRPEADAIRMELASLGNRVVVADGMEVNNPQFLKAGLRKVSGILTIGLEHLAGRDATRAAGWILKCWLIFLFRLGYTRVHQLAQRSEPIFRGTRFRWANRNLCLAGPPFEETLWALSRPRPLFFQGTDPESFLGFRDFQSLEDIRATEQRLEAAAALGDFFDRRDLPPERIKEICLEGGLGDRLESIQWAAVLHTIRAAEMLDGAEAFRLLAPTEIPAFLRQAFSGRPGRAGRSLDPGYTRSLLAWVRADTRLTSPEAGRILEEWIRAGTQALEQELGGLDPERAPDPRFIQSLCVRPASSP